MKTYTDRSNCARAARVALGKDAKPGLDFEITGKKGAFAWRALDKSKKPPKASGKAPVKPKKPAPAAPAAEKAPVAAVATVDEGKAEADERDAKADFAAETESPNGDTEAPKVTDAEALEAGMENDPAAVLEQPDDFALPADADDYDGDVADAAPPAHTPQDVKNAMASLSAEFAAKGMKVVFVDAAQAEAERAAMAEERKAKAAFTFGKLALTDADMAIIEAHAAARRSSMPAKVVKISAIAPIAKAAAKGEIAPLEIKSAANVTYQKRADALYKLALDGKLADIEAVEIGGTNTYARMLRNYKGALVKALTRKMEEYTKPHTVQ